MHRRREAGAVVAPGGIEAVYHDDRSTRQLKELVRVYDSLVGDTTRAMNRLKAIFRGERSPAEATISIERIGASAG